MTEPGLRYLSVCSGIEAASVAWHPLEWKPLAFSEIEPFPRAVLAHRYPNVPCHGDFTKLRDEPFIVDADVLVGGTPCQAFSVAGLRNSLADDRGNLSLEYVRLADAIDDLRLSAGRKPAVILWENVPGVLSVKDNAFGCFLAALAGDVAPYVPPRGKWTDAGVVAGPQRTVAWRILDAQYFGVAQRRRRVFVCGVAVSHPRAREIATSLFPVTEGVRRDNPPRREAGQIAPTIPARSLGGGGLGTDFDCDGGVIRAFAGTVESDIAATIQTTCHDYSRADGFNMVAHTLKGEGFDASEDGTGRGTPLVPVAYRTTGNDGVYETGEIVAALTTATDPNSHVLAFSAKDHGADATADLSPTLRAMPHHESHANGGGQMAVAYPLQEVGKRTGTSTTDPRAGIGIGQDGDAMYTLQAGAQHGVACEPYTLAIRGRGDTHNLEARQDGLANSLLTPNGGRAGIGVGAVAAGMAVRRLTPVECERLQGFPDGWTNIPWRGKPEAPDGPRYKALGNSMAVPCMRWIGKRIEEALQ